jgi:hypothetical protein
MKFICKIIKSKGVKALSEIVKAIEQLEIKRNDMELCAGLIKSGNQFIPKQSTPLMKAIKIAIKSLKKQKPKKIKEKNGWLSCPTCNICLNKEYCLSCRGQIGRQSSHTKSNIRLYATWSVAT